MNAKNWLAAGASAYIENTGREDIGGNMLFLALLFAVVGGISSGYQHSMQLATLYIGKLIAPQGIDERLLPQGYQHAITPPRFWINQDITILAVIGLLVTGFISGWFLIPIFLIIVAVVSTVVRKIRPSDIEFYLVHLICGMGERKANYLKSNDLERADAAQEMIDLLTLYYHEIEGTQKLLPKWDYVTKMPLGGYNDDSA